MKAHWIKYHLNFKKTARTSHGAYDTRTVWYLILKDGANSGIGECAPLNGLSKESPEQVEHLLQEICNNPEDYLWSAELIQHIPSVHFALETAWKDFNNGGTKILYPSAFTDGKAGIPINGLIWMGDESYMQQQIEDKLKSGFKCLKLKIGGLDFKQELEILKSIRRKYNPQEITLRLDANGAFKPEEALEKLYELAPLHIHSIEQPIAAGQWDQMEMVCRESPIPIALDEELIGIHHSNDKIKLLETVQPSFLILKPSLHGGFSGCTEWISLAGTRHIKWWVTSYLESNIGLNAISQWAYQTGAKGYQGLGTGSLYVNNIPSPLEIKGEELWFNANAKFQMPENLMIP